MTGFDRRTTPVRDDLAASSFKGRIASPRFADGKPHIMVRGRMALRAQPSADALQETELLYGETFVIYDAAHGWAWGQSGLDSYVGYIHTLACMENPFVPDHRVSALATPLLPAPDIKRPPLDMLPMNAKVQVFAREKGFARVAESGYVRERHLVPLAEKTPDWVAVAQRFLGTPYVWGGKTHAGMDCSGLVQTALETAGRAVPRDTDMQEKAIGSNFGASADFSNLARGDLVFWDGHVGVMTDAQDLLHANAFHMEVAIEPLAVAIPRIASALGPVTSIRRLQ